MDSKTRENLYDYIMTYWCTDDADNRALAEKWNSEISEEAKALHEECIIFDGCAFFIESYNWQLQQAKPTLLNLTIPDVFNPSSGGAAEKIAEALYIINKYPEHFKNILTVDDIYEAKRQGKVGLIIGAQSCDFIMSLDITASVELFARMGLRIMQIAYHTRSFAADGCATGTDAGITVQGKQMIRAMEKYGITVDLSHVGYRSTMEAMDYAEKPMIFSHANPRALFDHFRNITDEQAKKCASIGGTIGVASFSPILYDGKNFPSIDRYIDAVAYYADLVGIDHVSLGLDSNAEPGAYARHEARNVAESFLNEDAGKPFCVLGYEEGRGKASVFTDGIYGIANYPNIVDKLLKRGFSTSDVKKVMGENAVRVFKATWK